MSTNEVAERVGKTRVRINQYIQEGLLPAQKVGRDYVIKESDVEKIENLPETRGRKKKKSS